MLLLMLLLFYLPSQKVIVNHSITILTLMRFYKLSGVGKFLLDLLSQSQLDLINRFKLGIPLINPFQATGLFLYP